MDWKSLSVGGAEDLMEEQEETRSVENGSERGQELQEKLVKQETLLQFLDSTDGYLTLLDSLSSILRQGWLELASARHSMGASRINGALLDLKVHSAATSLQVSEQDVDSMEPWPCFILRKWVSSDNEKCTSGEENSREDKLQMKSNSPQLQHRNNTQISEEKASARIGTPLMHDDQVQKQRKKSLSVFGALVSPKLRAAQLSFETALETLVEIANMRSAMLSTFEQVHKELEGTKG